MSIHLPKGFRAAGVHSGVKRNTSKLDLSLIVSDKPATAAGVYTQNLVCGAPVVVDRERTPRDNARAIVINSGVANACTGEQGIEDAKAMTRCVANAVGAEEEQVLVMSTGVIGQMLPMEKIEKGIEAATGLLGTDDDSLSAAARGMLTTDTCQKISGRQIDADGTQIALTGVAKGAAMIGPNMATMLAVILTDASIDCETAHEWLRTAVEDSFNCISVEGHTSTSDTVLFLANGATSDRPLSGESQAAFRDALGAVCKDLAIAIIDDGEGATHRITIDITGANSKQDARTIAKTIAESALVKTAITGADPNWGRIVSAAGYAGVPFDPRCVRLVLNGMLLYENGAPVVFDAESASQSIAGERNVEIELSIGPGDGAARFWTTDLTAEYVRLNADYHT